MKTTIEIINGKCTVNGKNFNELSFNEINILDQTIKNYDSKR